jgi:hypothetical protein
MGTSPREWLLAYRYRVVGGTRKVSRRTSGGTASPIGSRDHASQADKRRAHARDVPSPESTSAGEEGKSCVTPTAPAQPGPTLHVVTTPRTLGLPGALLKQRAGMRSPPDRQLQAHGEAGIAAHARDVPTDPALAAGRAPSDDDLARVLHCFRWHVALESRRRQGLVTVDASSGAIFDPACRVRVPLQDPATGGWQVGDVTTGESVAGTARRGADRGRAEHAAGVQRPISRERNSGTVLLRSLPARYVPPATWGRLLLAGRLGKAPLLMPTAPRCLP